MLLGRKLSRSTLDKAGDSVGLLDQAHDTQRKLADFQGLKELLRNNLRQKCRETINPLVYL